jgi:hypothetical protein
MKPSAITICLVLLCFLSAKSQTPVSVETIQNELSKAKAYTLAFFTKGTMEEKANDASQKIKCLISSIFLV